MKFDLFLSYIRFEKRFSPHTIKAYQNDLEQFETYVFAVYGEVFIKEISHIHIRSWIIKLMEDGMSPKSINRKLSTLKSLFQFLLKKEKIEIDPMLKVVSPKTGKRLPAFVEEQKMDSLLEDITFPEGFKGLRDKLVLEILYQTGIRRSELIHLQISDIDFQNQLIKVLGKGNKERLIPINRQLRLLINDYLALRKTTFPDLLEIGQLMLTDKGKPMYPKFVYNLVKKYLSYVTTQEHRSPHILRHSFATHLSNNGCLLYTSPSPRDQRGSRMPSSA